MKKLLAGALIAAALPAAAQECAPLRSLCTQMRSSPELFIDGGRGLVPNPAHSTRLTSSLKSLGLASPDPAGAARAQALFESLRAALVARVSEQPAGTSRDAYLAYLGRLSLRTDRAREDYSASTSPDAVFINSWMTRLDPAALAWVLGHELGHSADPCWQVLMAGFAPNMAANLESASQLDPARASACPVPGTAGDDSELYADALGASLFGDIVAALPIPDELLARRVAFLQHGLQPGCGDPAASAQVRVFLSEPRLRSLLRCEEP
jgi:hypothetical protein